MTASNRWSTTRGRTADVAVEAAADVGEVTGSVVAVVVTSGDVAEAVVTTGVDVDEVVSEASRVTTARMVPMGLRRPMEPSNCLAAQRCLSRSPTPNVLAVSVG